MRHETTRGQGRCLSIAVGVGEETGALPRGLGRQGRPCVRGVCESSRVFSYELSRKVSDVGFSQPRSGRGHSRTDEIAGGLAGEVAQMIAAPCQIATDGLAPSAHRSRGDHLGCGQRYNRRLAAKVCPPNAGSSAGHDEPDSDCNQTEAVAWDGSADRCRPRRADGQCGDRLRGRFHSLAPIAGALGSSPPGDQAERQCGRQRHRPRLRTARRSRGCGRRART